jgi:hypothetical protein
MLKLLWLFFVSKVQKVYCLALIKVEILFLFSLKRKRLERKAGKWIPKMPEPFASN